MTNSQNTNKAAEARRAYYKRWRAANKDKVKQYNETYWQRRAERMERGKLPARASSASTASA